MPTHSMNSISDGTAPNGILDMVHLQKSEDHGFVEVEQDLMVAAPCTCGRVSGLFECVDVKRPKQLHEERHHSPLGDRRKAVVSAKATIRTVE
jgi:hypothetical protein